MPKPNRPRGSSFDDFLRVKGLHDDAQALALKRVIAEAVEEGMLDADLTKVEMARRMRTSRSQLDRVLDPACTSVQLDTLIKAASALGRVVQFRLKRATPARQLADVVGCVGYRGPSKSIKDMEAAVMAQARKRR
jgi:predicted XRE-type DNA-binding protein